MQGDEMVDKNPPVLENYSTLLADIKQRIGQSQTRAILAVNSELISLYWSIGQLLDSRQKQEGWGARVIPQLSLDIRNELPDIKGFSERNIKQMLAFYREYPDLLLPSTTKKSVPIPIVQPVVAQLPIYARIPWVHNTLLIQKLKDLATRYWYAKATLDNGWSHSVLLMQIQTEAHTRQGAAISNFALKLPSPQSDLVQQALKDPYLFDFLTLSEPFVERELETGLVKHLEKFLLELGRGFAFVGRQYHLDVGERDFYIDLLFYHLQLRCFVVIELKRGEFLPEYAGKMNFYCSVVDEKLKHTQDAPTIGLILCQQPNAVVAEYALRDVDKPIGVSTFELTRALPKELVSSLPSIEQIERELGGK
jgi:predicted nuclease of restriction endonuclease-like (RecB) superfamily